MSVLSTMPPRKLRIFAFDPSMGRRHQTLPLNEVIVAIPWEMDKLEPGVPFVGPVGEYVEVIDYDPSLDLVYAPINLHDPRLLADNGLRPAAWNPQFHQQMTYAVAMNTIVNFESALGRVALWAPRDHDEDGRWINPQYVQRLRIYPHALRDANAYYSPEKKALLFGYFEAGEGQSGAPAGTVIFTCLSHDIIAHETSHALLDGMHPRFSEATNPDVLALHEAFADIVAIFQHFSFADVLKDQIARTRGDLESQNLLGQLAQEFGKVLGRGAALRDALGGEKDGIWRAHEPDPKVLRETQEVHARGAILVAAVFRAFLSIYRSRIADLLRIASSGTGILPEGELHPDLVNRLAQEASKSARHILQMCIRALDYCPPVDVTFGDYLRAIITADHDLYPEDEHHYRVALMEAFLAWGIVPREMPIVSVETLLWPTMRDAAADYKAGAPDLAGLKSDLGYLLSRPLEMIDELKTRGDFHDREGQKFLDGLDRTAREIFEEMNKAMGNRLPEKANRSKPSLREILARNLLELGLEADRKVEWLARDLYGRLFWGLITEPKNAPLRDIIRIRTDADAPATVRRSRIVTGPAIEVHSVRMAARRGNRDQMEREYVVELTQTRDGYLDPKKQEAADKGNPPGGPHDFYFRRGCTLLIDADTFEIRRVIRTAGDICDDAELERMRAFLTRQAKTRQNAFTASGARPVRPEVFAHLHRHGS
ncbi:hypothetical protein PYH37_004574 [Sinorhizobium numidicum]|uniref:Peptidase M4 n=1 Tax=Sinorhizobium numidicum TaxID=680248 RepID=A0ABY8CWC7_9HYPH|nr:hypothetical protein [Sinorhizobium numidicum]WEX76279.1 hypothetical protein PYH37_004574 [Sinorhizobium numidicum]WEX82939.1 hypothetical protein PYH38_005286 [Sinorhizobium numidicum]